jgi:hypothetical protein
MTDLEQYIYAKLDAMQTEKAQQPIHPNMLTKYEFFSAVNKDIRTVLNKLYIEKKLKVHPTVHPSVNDFIELVKEDENEI